MSEPTRRETQLGLAELKKRLQAAGLQIINQHRNTGLQRSTYFAIGNSNRQTDISIFDNFLDDLPNTKEYQAVVDSYARAVAGRLKCGHPDVFCCVSGMAIQIDIRWPIESAMYDGKVSTFVLIFRCGCVGFGSVLSTYLATKSSSLKLATTTANVSSGSYPLSKVWRRRCANSLKANGFVRARGCFVLTIAPPIRRSGCLRESPR
jgi:hypothetical protein